MSRRPQNFTQISFFGICGTFSRAGAYQKLVRQREREPRLPYVSIGYARYAPGTDRIEDTAAEADRMMYRYKAAHRESIVNAPSVAFPGGPGASSGLDGM